MNDNASARPDRRAIIGYLIGAAGLAGFLLMRDGAELRFIFIVLVAGGLYPILLSGEKRRRNMIIYMGMIAVGAVIGVIDRSARYAALEEHPVLARAVVLDTGHYPRKYGGGKRWAEYGYMVNGVSYKGKEYAPACAPGDSIVIRYAATDPSISYPVVE